MDTIFGRTFGWILTGVFSLAVAAGTAQAATITDLGTLGGTYGLSEADGINDSGQVVGESNNGSGWRAFLYTPGSGMTNLGALVGLDSVATGINASGQVVGSSRNASGYQNAFLYTPGSGMTNLGTLGGPYSDSDACAWGGRQSEALAFPSGFLRLQTANKDEEEKMGTLIYLRTFGWIFAGALSLAA